MSKPKHTPGPWETEHRENRCGERSPRDEPGWYDVFTAIPGAAKPGRPGVVADTLNRDHLIDPDEDRANAMLIAAAPLMLETLRSIAQDFDCDTCAHRNGTECRKCSAADAYKVATGIDLDIASGD